MTATYEQLLHVLGRRRDIAVALVRDFDDGELRFQVVQSIDGSSLGNGGQKKTAGVTSPQPS